MDIGVQINQYQIVEHIGRGGMADVWSARDQRLNRMVAIKTIAHGLSQEIDPVSLFKREAQTIAQMEHPHILPIYDFGEHRGRLYIVMRYVSGGSLGSLLERGPLPLPEVLRLASAIAAALDYAHLNKIVHLDLKPQNILLDSFQSPYLADFGLATVLDREGRAMNPGSGTLMYMAPEQLTSELLDHRADIYSFGVMLYHMITGRLPFDGSIPLALKQLQFQESLAPIDGYAPTITEILRRAVAIDPIARQATVSEILSDIQAVLSDTVDVFSMFSDDLEDDYLSGVLAHTSDANLLEAADLYSRARHTWAAGQGRFLLGVTHFMVMNDFYRASGRYGLTIDNEGKQMLLRGALEYDLDVAFWWDALDDVDRRWVCFHALRSGNTPARIRALYRLETLPEADTPRIPRMVAKALQDETDEEARFAALQVLGTRARLMKPSLEYDIKTEYRGRMLTTMTRVDLQARQDGQWQEAIYSPEIDLLLAETALDRSVPAVADFAGRVIGRIRSLTAVRHLAEQQQANRPGALRALALVRDESPSLPPVVSPPVRGFVWLSNTARRIADNPLTLTWRFLLAVLGGTLAMGMNVYATFRTQDFFSPQRISNSLSFGLSFGLFIGVLVLLTDEIPSRTRGFWSLWQRLLFSVVLGTGWATLTWAMARYLYQYQAADWQLSLFGGFGLALGLILASTLNLRAWIALPVTAVCIYLPVYATYHNFCQQLYLCTESPSFTLTPAPAIGLVLGVFSGIVLRMQRRAPVTLDAGLKPAVAAVVGVALGSLWAVAVWLAEMNTLNAGTSTWTGVIGFVAAGLGIGGAIAYLSSLRLRVGFTAAAIAAFLAFYSVLNPFLQLPQLLPNYDDPQPLLYYDYPIQIVTVAAWFALLIAFGAYALLLPRDAEYFRAFVRRRRAVPAVAEPVPPPTVRLPPVAAEAGSAAPAVDVATTQLSEVPALDLGTKPIAGADESTQRLPLDDKTQPLPLTDKARHLPLDDTTQPLPKDTKPLT